MAAEWSPQSFYLVLRPTLYEPPSNLSVEKAEIFGFRFLLLWKTNENNLFEASSTPINYFRPAEVTRRELRLHEDLLPPLLSQICQGCGKVVSPDSRAVYQLGSFWHREHLRCSKCSEPVAAPYLSKGAIFCQSDFFRMLWDTAECGICKSSHHLTVDSAVSKRPPLLPVILFGTLKGPNFFRKTYFVQCTWLRHDATASGLAFTKFFHRSTSGNMSVALAFQPWPTTSRA